MKVGGIWKVFVEERREEKYRSRKIIDLNERECFYRSTLNTDVFFERVTLDLTDIPFVQKERAISFYLYVDLK